MVMLLKLLVGSSISRSLAVVMTDVPLLKIPEFFQSPSSRSVPLPPFKIPPAKTVRLEHCAPVAMVGSFGVSAPLGIVTVSLEVGIPAGDQFVEVPQAVEDAPVQVY